MTEVFIQWKGTDACFDFYCECGTQGHHDGYFAYVVKCSGCGKAWKLPTTLTLVETDDPTGAIILGEDE